MIWGELSATDPVNCDWMRKFWGEVMDAAEKCNKDL